MELLVISNRQDITKSRIFAVVIISVLLLLISLIHITSVTDPPIQPEITKEVPVEFMELKMEPSPKSGGSPGGKGSPSDDQLVKKNPPQTQEKLTTKDPNATAVQSGKSNKTNTDKQTDNKATTTVKSDDPFGKGGKGGGKDSGSGGVIGDDNGSGGKGTGTGNGDGSGSGVARKRYNEISTDNIYTNSLVKVTLILNVDDSGKVIGHRTVGKETTTNDQSIINKVAAACKSQLKYMKGKGITEEYYHVWIQPG
mgnify:CR=1 FL=1